jgi:hypothetical protein
VKEYLSFKKEPCLKNASIVYVNRLANGKIGDVVYTLYQGDVYF